ncbi:hypothetical protein [Thalassolituus sp.]|uniref:hypothetical protein n=1 Tax=Thalassolituus sp. TaxID=2030822 RepID=UPI0026177DBA|nr:hypothetical protein [Thalassolituus sp.]
MGLFGGGNSSKSTTNNIDNRALNAAGNSGLAVGGDNNRVTVTDQGATNNALNAMRAGNADALAFANEFGENAMSLAGRSLTESFDYSAGLTDRVFDAMDASSAKAFEFVGDAFDGALVESRMARENAVGAALETNERISEIYRSQGRESAEQSINMLKVLAIVVGVIGVGVVLRAS